MDSGQPAGAGREKAVQHREKRLQQEAEARRAADRAAVASRWLESYGEPIDCEALATHLSLEAVDRLRLQYAAHLVARKLADELERQQESLLEWIKRVKVPGSPRRLGELLEKASETDTAGNGVLLRLQRHRQQAEDTIRELRRLADSQEMAHRALRGTEVYPDSWSEELRTQFERIAHQGRALGVWGPESASKMPDEPLAQAALIASEWVRARHRNSSGELDSETSWLDVAACLAWHGHEDATADRLRLLVARFTRSLSRSGA